MKSLGEYLRSERLNRGISLEEISRDTRISTRMLQAIEDGNTESLPAGVLVKGFLRAYAQKIGLDPETVILRYQDLYEEEGARREALEKFHERFRPVPTRRRFLVPGTTAALVICLLLAWLLSPRDRHQTAPPSTKAPAVVPQEAPPAPLPVEPAPASLPLPSPPSIQPAPLAVPPPMRETDFPSAAPSAGLSEPATSAAPSGRATPAVTPTPNPVSALPPRTGAPPPTQSAPTASVGQPPEYMLRGEVTETTWLKISVDNGKELEYLLQPGEQVRWQAKSSFSLLVGNAAGLRLFLNDRPLKPLGQKGQVVGISLPNDSLVQTTGTAPPERPTSR
ncbi:MAG TPA: RodZ domain-containing protein [Syntrophobacteria bacterium]|nr:RodZ domain-containing protein [Syntrophobacteria bacterium]